MSDVIFVSKFVNDFPTAPSLVCQMNFCDIEQVADIALYILLLRTLCLLHCRVPDSLTKSTVSVVGLKIIWR